MAKIRTFKTFILKAKTCLTSAFRKLCCPVAQKQAQEKEHSAHNPLCYCLHHDLGKSFHVYVSIFSHLQNLANPTEWPQDVRMVRCSFKITRAAHLPNCSDLLTEF